MFTGGTISVFTRGHLLVLQSTFARFVFMHGVRNTVRNTVLTHGQLGVIFPGLAFNANPKTSLNTLVHFAQGCSDFNLLPTHGFSELTPPRAGEQGI